MSKGNLVTLDPLNMNDSSKNYPRDGIENGPERLGMGNVAATWPRQDFRPV